MPTNETSPNPIGFVVDPATGASPPPAGDTHGVDVTRTLLNQLGVDLMWLPIATYNSQINTNTGTTFQTLNVTQGATCTGSISGTTLTIASCSSGVLAGLDSLSGVAANTTIIKSCLQSCTVGGSCTHTGYPFTPYTGTGGAGTYQVNNSQNVGTTTITVTSNLFQSADFLTLSDQVPSCPPAAPTAIWQGAQTFGPPSGTANPLYPKQPLGWPTNVLNMFFVTTLNPPASQSGGKLYGFSWEANNGVAIAEDVFGYPITKNIHGVVTSAPPRPSNLAHEMGHTGGIDHTTFAAGPWTAPPYSNPLGVVPPIPAAPLAGECDPKYPACAANLMTTGMLRTESTVGCVLAGFMGEAMPASCSGKPTLYNGMADQVSTPSSATSTQLPESQQAQVLTGGSGLLSPFGDPPMQTGFLSPLEGPIMQSGFLNPIPHETTKAQLGTGGSATDPVIFDLSSPTGGKLGETLAAWVLTLPPGQTFAKHSRFRVVSQSRADLVQDVTYYPDAGNNPIMKDIAYHPGADDNSANPNIGTAADSPCTSATAECLMVKFQPPGLGTHDSISFSNGILKSILFSKGMFSGGGAPITNDDLCKAKITYIFSDGYATTSKLGPCPAVSLPLISSSWRPDPTVSPRIVDTPELLAQGGAILPAAAGAQKLPPGGDPGNNNPPPAGPILDLNGTPILGGGNGTYQMYTVDFIATLANTAITFAFREDPAFISFANASVVDLTAGSGNLLMNGDFSGGVYTDNGNPSTPVDWTYANMYGATFGGGVQSGATDCYGVAYCWYDGAVQAYDAISQTIATTPGHQYQISFLVADNSGCGTCNFSDLSTNGDTTDTGGNGKNVTVYAQAGLPPVSTTMGCTPDPQHPTQCKVIPLETGCSDCNSLEEADQPGQICSSGALTGTINTNLTVSAPQNCVFQNPCEIKGNLTIKGGMVYLACEVDGNVMQTGGGLVLDTSASVGGNVQISGASAFTIGASGPFPAVTINGNLQIQNVPGTQQGTVCDTKINGNLQVQSNSSPIEIGGSLNCGDTVSGNLQVQNNRAITDVSFATVGGTLQCQSNTPTTTSSSNTVKGNKQGCN
jgi:hypothetical protein